MSTPDYHSEYFGYFERLFSPSGSILEVGGILPTQVDIRHKPIERWVCLEAPDYKTSRRIEIERLVRGNSEIELLFSDLRSYCESTNERFDFVYSTNAFEHICELDEAIDSLWGVMNEGGFVFSVFAPIWSAWNGHHHDNIVLDGGRIADFTNGPLHPWEHLMYGPDELERRLVERIGQDAAARLIHMVYEEDSISRLFFEDYIDIITQSRFICYLCCPIYSKNPTRNVIEAVNRIHGTRILGPSGFICILGKGHGASIASGFCPSTLSEVLGGFRDFDLA